MEIVPLAREHCPALTEFLRRVWPNSPRGEPSTWEWIFRSNPDAVETPEIWLLLDGQRVVGQLPTLRTTLEFSRQRLPARTTFDFHVLPEYRNRGAGVLLVAALTREPGLLLNLGPNRVAAPVFARLGWKSVTVLPRATAVLDAGRTLMRWGLPSELADSLTWLGQMPGRLLEQPPRHAPRGRIELLSDALPGSEFEQFWKSWSPRPPAILYRDPARLVWRYCDSPLHRYTIHVHRVDGRAIGWMVTRLSEHKGVPIGRIVDLLGPPASAEQLVRAAMAHYRAARAAVLHTRVPHPDYVGLFTRAGFRVRTSSSHVIRLMFRAGEGVDPLVLRVARNWFLTLGDGDSDW